MITRITNLPVFKSTIQPAKKFSYEDSHAFDIFLNKPQMQTKPALQPTQSANTQPSKSQEQKPKDEQTKKHIDKKTLLLTFGALAAAGAIVYGVTRGKVPKSSINADTANLGESVIRKSETISNIGETIAKKFPQDEKYRLRLAQAIGLSEKDVHKLSSIAGVEELADILEKNQDNPKIFSIGNAIYDNSGKVAGFHKDNIKSGDFGINLHIHTDNSAGKFSVKKLLDDAAAYANERMQLKNEPFYIAITDHDSTEGCKEAIEIIKNDPNKFRNLRVFLGMESTTTYRHIGVLRQNCDLHVLSYGINPYAQEMDKFLTFRITSNHEYINKALKNATKAYSELTNGKGDDFNLDDFSKLSKGIKTGLRKSNYYLKDYLQFKLIYSQSVLNNDKLQKILADNKINLSDFDYTTAIKFMDQNPDYSKGQKYYEYYYKALKDSIVKHIKSKNSSINEKELQTTFTNLPEKLKSALDEIEHLVNTKNSTLYIPPIKIPQYRVALMDLAKMEDGVLSIAHPGLLFPSDCVKFPDELPRMFNQSVFKAFKDYGGDKAKYIEGFYQSYHKTPNLPLYKEIIELGKQAGYKFTGGIDTHGADIFSV